MDSIHQCIEKYANKDIYKEKGMGITVLKPGHLMPLHADKGYLSPEIDVNIKTHSGFASRDISSVFYWNDEYEGGEIVFPNQNIRIKPSSGMLIFFPSDNNFSHKVLPVVSGIRYVSTSFWCVKE